MNHKNSLFFPDDIEMTGNAKKLICAFLTDRYEDFLCLYYSYSDIFMNKRELNKLSFFFCVVIKDWVEMVSMILENIDFLSQIYGIGIPSGQVSFH